MITPELEQLVNRAVDATVFALPLNMTMSDFRHELSYGRWPDLVSLRPPFNGVPMYAINNFLGHLGVQLNYLAKRAFELGVESAKNPIESCSLPAALGDEIKAITPDVRFQLSDSPR